MAVVLPYMAPAVGHLFPFCALLTELAARDLRRGADLLESVISA